MKIKDARRIVGKMVQWSMLSHGVPLNGKPEQITENLQTLLKANKMVEVVNKRSQDRIDKIIKEKGKWSGKRSLQMTIADRGIAALYVAANFLGDDPGSADILAMHNDNVVMCLNRNKLQSDD